MNLAQILNYGLERLAELKLTAAEGFTYTSQGNIKILYHCLNGDRQKHKHASARKTFSECPDEFANLTPYYATRFAPQNIPFGRKYYRPAGVSALTYIPKRTIDLFKPVLKAATSVPLPLLQWDTIKTAIFTEGEIKTAYANKHYFNDAAMFGFSGISNYKLCNEIKTALKRNAFQNLVINYDADATRADDKTRLAQFFSSALGFYNELKTFYSIQNAPLPRVYINIQNSNAHKGIDDILQAYGKQAADAFRTFQNSEYFTFAELTAGDAHQCLAKFFNYNTGQNNDNNALTLKAPYYSYKSEKVRTRFSSILKSNDITASNFFGKVYNVATGTGKTTAVIQTAKTEKIIFFAPLNGIITQVYNDAIKQGIDAAIFNGNKQYRRNVQGIIEKQNSLFAVDLPQFIICTYQSASKLHKLLQGNYDKYNIIIDEFHTLASAGYINEHANNVLNITPYYKSITGLTGTPIDISHPYITKLQNVNVKLTGAPLTPAHVVIADDMLQAAANIYIKAHSEGRRATVYYNNKSEGLQDFLQLIGNTPAHLFNSKTKGNFSEFLSTGLLDDTSGIIATDSYSLGINNNDERACDVIIVGEHHPINIKQFKERERLAECTLYIVKAKQPDKSEPIFKGDEKEKNEFIQNTKKQIEHLNTCSDKYLQMIRGAFQQMHVLETPAGLEINYLSIDNLMFKYQTAYFNNSPYKLLSELSKYNFAGFTDKKLNIKRDEFKRGDEFKTASKLRRQQNKAAKHELFCDAANVLHAADDAKITALNKAAECADDSEFYQMFIDIRKHCKDDAQALKLFELCEGKRAKVMQTILRLNAKKAKFTSHYLGNAPAAVLKSFKAGDVLTADEIKTKFIECLQADDTINTAEYNGATINKYLKKLRIFFDVKLYGKEKKHYMISKLANCFF